MRTFIPETDGKLFSFEKAGSSGEERGSAGFFKGRGLSLTKRPTLLTSKVEREKPECSWYFGAG